MKLSPCTETGRPLETEHDDSPITGRFAARHWALEYRRFYLILTQDRDGFHVPDMGDIPVEPLASLEDAVSEARELTDAGYYNH